MIKEALFPQPWIEEPDDPQYEINACVTKLITELPQAEQDRVKGYRGSRLGNFRSFILKTKEVKK